MRRAIRGYGGEGKGVGQVLLGVQGFVVPDVELTKGVGVHHGFIQGHAKILPVGFIHFLSLFFSFG